MFYHYYYYLILFTNFLLLLFLKLTIANSRDLRYSDDEKTNLHVIKIRSDLNCTVYYKIKCLDTEKNIKKELNIR